MSICPICESDKNELYYNYGTDISGLKSDKVINLVCSDCGSVFLKDIDFKHNEYYKNYVSESQPELEHIPLAFKEHLESIGMMRAQYINRFLAPDSSILDIGCGFGATLNALGKLNSSFKLKGINPEKSYADFGHKTYGLDIEPLMFEEFETSEKFDLVILDNVLEHFADPQLNLKRIKQMLNHKGKIFIATNNLDDPHGELWQNLYFDHIFTPSVRSLDILLDRNGFTSFHSDTDGHITYQGYRYPYQYMMAVAKDSESKSEISKEEMNKTVKLRDEYLKKDDTSIQYNHTLPPAEYLYRRLFLIIAEDADTLEQMRVRAAESGLATDYFLLLKQDTALTLKGHPKGLKPENTTFDNLNQFTSYCFENVTPLNELVLFHCKNTCDIPANLLERKYEIFRKTGKDYLMYDLHQFIPFKIEFLSEKAILQKPVSEAGEHFYFNFFGSDPSDVIWPDNTDSNYYYIDKKEDYFHEPICVALDLVANCNKVCPKCQFHSKQSPYRNIIDRKARMPLELVRKVCSEASKMKNKPIITPTFSGEPLIYEHFSEFLDILKEFDLRCAITTNGVALTEKKLKNITDSGVVAEIVFSVDAYYQDTYNELQPGSKIEKINQVVQDTHKAGLRTGVHYTMNEVNKNEFIIFRDYWLDKIDYVSVSIQQDQFTNSSLVLSPFMDIPERIACHTGWTTMYIRHNGSVSFCGFDIPAESSMNANSMTLKDIWMSDYYNQWREEQSSGKYDHENFSCMCCPCWSGSRKVFQKSNGVQESKSFINIVYRNVGK